MRSHLHGPRLATHRKPVSGVARHRRPVRVQPSDDFRRGERLTGLLDVRGPVLRHLDRIRCHVLHRIHPQPVRHLPGPVHPHQGPTEVTAGLVEGTDSGLLKVGLLTKTLAGSLDRWQPDG